MGIFSKNSSSTQDNGATGGSGSGSLWSRLFKTRSRLVEFVSSSDEPMSASGLDELEDSLIMADLGVEFATEFMDLIRLRCAVGNLTHNQVIGALKEEMTNRLLPFQVPLDVGSNQPFVIMLVGVNGVGKTTTAARLAAIFQNSGYSVTLAACDTFRSAATEQLKEWGNRLKIPVIAQGHGADAAAVAHDAMKSAKSRGTDILIIDTAGRQHTHDRLMQELGKIGRVLNKIEAGAPHEVLMTVDAGNGQNVLSQLEEFNKFARVSGIAVTKLDGTAKGGILFALVRRFELPIRYLGVGESIDDLRVFDAPEFVNALVGLHR